MIRFEPGSRDEETFVERYGTKRMTTRRTAPNPKRTFFKQGFMTNPIIGLNGRGVNLPPRRGAPSPAGYMIKYERVRE